MCAVSMLVGAPRNCSRFVCRYGFHEDILDLFSTYPYLCTAVFKYSTLPWRYFYQTRANGCIETKFRHNECTQHDVSLHGGHVVPCALRSSTATVKAIYCGLEQLVASLSAADEGGNAAAGTYHPKTEGYYIRRHLYKPPGLLYYGGCTWTRISSQPIIAITWHFSQQTLFEPLTVSGARAFCFDERYRDVLYQNLDENNNTQTSTDCCTVVLRT